jgi:hypothetical protein
MLKNLEFQVIIGSKKRRVNMKRSTTKNKVIIIEKGTPKRRVNLIDQSSKRLERIKFWI